MFIEKDERQSRARPARRSRWDGGSRRRPPRNWFKVVRLTLYTLIGLLGGLAALAAAALFFDHGSGLPPPPVTTPAPAPTEQAANPPPAAPPSRPPVVVVPPVPLPSPTPASPAPASPAPAPPTPAPPAAAVPAGSPDSAAVQALQEQIREANSALSGLRDEAAKIRQDLSQVTRQRPAAPLPAATPAPAPAAPAAAPADEWSDAEHTVQTLAQREKRPPAAAAAPAAPSAPSAPVARPAQTAPPQAAPPQATPSEDQVAANAAPTLPPGMPRPRVFLHYPAGSRGGLQEATNLAQRLLFSDFAYGDTRSTTDPPSDSVIRYFYPEDAPAAARLAALLGGDGDAFRVQDATSQPGHAKHGTLEVWLGR